MWCLFSALCGRTAAHRGGDAVPAPLARSWLGGGASVRFISPLVPKRPRRPDTGRSAHTCALPNQAASSRSSRSSSAWDSRTGWPPGGRAGGSEMASNQGRGQAEGDGDRGGGTTGEEPRAQHVPSRQTTVRARARPVLLVSSHARARARRPDPALLPARAVPLPLPPAHARAQDAPALGPVVLPPPSPRALTRDISGASGWGARGLVALRHAAPGTDRGGDGGGGALSCSGSETDFAATTARCVREAGVV